MVARAKRATGRDGTSPSPTTPRRDRARTRFGTCRGDPCGRPSRCRASRKNGTGQGRPLQRLAGTVHEFDAAHVGATLAVARPGIVQAARTGRAGWPRVVSHPRLPQIRTCPTRASGSSDHGIATPKRAPARRRFRRRSANCRTCVETAVGSVSSPSVRPTVHDPIRRFPPPGPRGAGSPTSTVLSADSDFSTPVPPHFVFLRLAVPRGCLFRSRGSGPLPGPGLLFIAAVRAASPVETSRPPRFLGDPCLHAPLSDPGGTACARPSRRRDGAFRSCHSVGFRDVYGFRGSITQPARLPVYASQPGSPPLHATLGSGWSVYLGRSGLSPAGSHRRFLSCHNMPSPFTKLRLAQDKPVPYNASPGPCTNSMRHV